MSGHMGIWKSLSMSFNLRGTVQPWPKPRVFGAQPLPMHPMSRSTPSPSPTLSPSPNPIAPLPCPGCLLSPLTGQVSGRCPGSAERFTFLRLRLVLHSSCSTPPRDHWHPLLVGRIVGRILAGFTSASVMRQLKSQYVASQIKGLSQSACRQRSL